MCVYMHHCTYMCGCEGGVCAWVRLICEGGAAAVELLHQRIGTLRNIGFRLVVSLKKLD